MSRELHPTLQQRYIQLQRRVDAPRGLWNAFTHIGAGESQGEQKPGVQQLRPCTRQDGSLTGDATKRCRAAQCATKACADA